MANSCKTLARQKFKISKKITILSNKKRLTLAQSRQLRGANRRARKIERKQDKRGC